ncbi:MAG: transglutaminase family protein [Bacteroidota bacterium]|nr:transglutaminase family protein [Bacteroidota bacterium]
MELIIESDEMKDYLKEVPPVIQFDTPLIQKEIKAITSQTASLRERAKLAFEFARDEIRHSFDSAECKLVTINAEEAIEKKEGICFAKSHVLASLLRGMGIPTGFCYQRTNNPKAGFALHGLNAIYLDDTGWFRVDPRGNKPGIDSEFSTDTEKLAYSIDPSKGEVDYPNVFPEPLPNVITAMQNSANVAELFYNRPESL